MNLLQIVLILGIWHAKQPTLPPKTAAAEVLPGLIH